MYAIKMVKLELIKKYKNVGVINKFVLKNKVF